MNLERRIHSDNIFQKVNADSRAENCQIPAKFLCFWDLPRRRDNP